MKNKIHLMLIVILLLFTILANGIIVVANSNQNLNKHEVLIEKYVDLNKNGKDEKIILYGRQEGLAYYDIILEILDSSNTILDRKNVGYAESKPRDLNVVNFSKDSVDILIVFQVGGKYQYGCYVYSFDNNKLNEYHINISDGPESPCVDIKQNYEGEEGVLFYVEGLDKKYIVGAKEDFEEVSALHSGGRGPFFDAQDINENGVYELRVGWTYRGWGFSGWMEMNKYYKYNTNIDKWEIIDFEITSSYPVKLLEAKTNEPIDMAFDKEELVITKKSRNFLNIVLSESDATLTYTVDNPDIIKVQPNGEIIGLKEGETNIIVTATKSGFKESTIEVPIAVKPRIEFDYESIKKLQERKDLIKILKEFIGQLTPFHYEDNTTLMELVDFSNFMISNASRGAVEARNNIVALRANELKPLANNALAIEKEIQDVFKTNNINPQRQLTSTVRFDALKLDASKPVHLVLNTSLIEELENIDAIQIALDIAEVTLNTNALKGELYNKEELRIEVRTKEDENGLSYELFFSDEEGQSIPRLENNITVSLPVGDLSPEFSAVFMNDGQNIEQLGGQYDPNTNRISFQTRSTGEYYILESKIEYKDIDHLTEEEQQAIRFMTSRGFISGRDEENFDPNAEITRGEFTSLLVRTFYALDRNLTTSFTDVTRDDWYYDYVASSEKEGIIRGYPDGTFKGEDIINREQIVAVAARALHEKKKYLYPENPEDYLSFLDSDAIEAWAKEEVALAYRETLIDMPENRMFQPQAAMTRADAVLIVYRLFQLLYEVSPTALGEADIAALAVVGGGTTPLSGVVPIAGGVVGIGALGGGFWYWRRFFRK